MHRRKVAGASFKDDGTSDVGDIAAVFDAAGVRVRSVPFTPAKVKAAIGGA